MCFLFLSIRPFTDGKVFASRSSGGRVDHSPPGLSGFVPFIYGGFHLRTSEMLTTGGHSARKWDGMVRTCEIYLAGNNRSERSI